MKHKGILSAIVITKVSKTKMLRCQNTMMRRENKQFENGEVTYEWESSLVPSKSEDKVEITGKFIVDYCRRVREFFS